MRELFEVSCTACEEDFGRLTITEIRKLFRNGTCPSCKKEKSIISEPVEDLHAPKKSRPEE